MEKIIINLIVGIIIGINAVFIFNNLTGRIVCLERYLEASHNSDIVWCNGNKSI